MTTEQYKEWMKKTEPLRKVVECVELSSYKDEKYYNLEGGNLIMMMDSLLEFIISDEGGEFLLQYGYVKKDKEELKELK